MKRIITKVTLSATFVLLFVSALAGCVNHSTEAESIVTNQDLLRKVK